jgi:protocatechuate 3,4-dioxygenase beta subunit
MLAGGAAFAAGETTGSPSGTSPSGAGASNCPSSSPPNQMTLLAGTPQTAIVQSAFATGLQVALTNSDGCPVAGAAGVPVTFTAPSAGASGVFSTSGSNAATVGSDASGAVAAPAFTANDTQGSYTVTASSQYGSVSFSLTNTAAGVAVRVTAVSARSQSARVTSRYRQPLQVRALDADGTAVAGATVTFTLGSAGSGACGATTASNASATFIGGGTQATARTGANGVASSPLLAANSATGSFTATAAVSSAEPTGASGKEGAAANGAATALAFSLRNLAGRPTKLTAGVGSTQSTTAGASFPIRLAVTVTDAEKNPVPGAQITFSAPADGASGRFTVRARGSHRTRSRGSQRHRGRIVHTPTVRIATNACGIAIAPVFTADQQQGGYIVKASARHARAAAFALVNEARGQSS